MTIQQDSCTQNKEDSSDSPRELESQSCSLEHRFSLSGPRLFSPMKQADKHLPSLACESSGGSNEHFSVIVNFIGIKGIIIS